MKAQQQRRSKPKDAGRRVKKKISVLAAERVEYVDYKDVNLLRRFMSDRAKIRARRVSGNDSQQQREVARAIKNAREMALLPYTSRVTTQRGPRADRGDRGDRVTAVTVAIAVTAGDRGDRGDRGPRTDATLAAPVESAEVLDLGADVGEAVEVDIDTNGDGEA